MRDERWIIAKDFRFEASHLLPNHDGKCARLHGHSWKMTVRFASTELVFTGPKQFMVADYGEIKAYVQPLVDEYLDHRHLNDTLSIYPTSENIAQWVFLVLRRRLPDDLAHMLHSVTIHETCTSEATYEGPPL